MFKVSFNFLGDDALLKYALLEHDRCCVMIYRMNGNLRFLTWIFYYLSIPAIDLLVILSIHKEIDITNRSLVGITVIIGVFALSILNYSMASVSVAAHRPYNKLYSIIVRKSITRALKLKVMGLIEKLSGPVIGIYCLDVFPFTNYEFYIYITNCILNFILIIGLFGH